VTSRILEGDCVELMAGLDEASVDAVVCDPPYELGFMGKAWDRTGVAYQASTWREAYRVLKPGGHLLAFGGTRTYHRLACAVEDAGFEIRDSLIWLYGSGFPKSLDVSKAIDKAAGAKREVVGLSPHSAARSAGTMATGHEAPSGYNNGDEGDRLVTAPATPEAEQWQGWGTALKPSHEPVVVARKPLVGTVAANVLEHGTGALNVSGCRVAHDEGVDLKREQRDFDRMGYMGTNGETEGVPLYKPEGRWPANVILSPDSAVELDEQSGSVGGNSTGPDGRARREYDHDNQIYGQGIADNHRPFDYADRGGASRFFYCAKASRGERNAGLEGFEKTAQLRDGARFHSGGRTLEEGEWVETGSEPQPKANVHPTVKPIDLMRWLCRLVTPPGGVVLDPFTGSGTTGIAAHLEGFDFIGCEREAEYAAIARARIEWWERFPAGTDVDKALGVAVSDKVAADAGQTPLFP
jgi:DNA modification methylase